MIKDWRLAAEKQPSRESTPCLLLFSCCKKPRAIPNRSPFDREADIRSPYWSNKEGYRRFFASHTLSPAHKSLFQHSFFRLSSSLWTTDKTTTRREKNRSSFPRRKTIEQRKALDDRLPRSSKGETNTKWPQSEWVDRGSMREIQNQKPEETREVVGSDKMLAFLL